MNPTTPGTTRRPRTRFAGGGTVQFTTPAPVQTRAQHRHFDAGSAAGGVSSTSGPPVDSMFSSVGSLGAPYSSIAPVHSNGLNIANVISPIGPEPSSAQAWTPAKSLAGPSGAYSAYGFSGSGLPFTPGQIDPHFEQGGREPALQPSARKWVTVWGFPASRLPFVLRKFSEYGEIVGHRTAGQRGANFVHIEYANALAASKAKAQNGKTFDGFLMLGVADCIDFDVLNPSRAEANVEDGEVLRTHLVTPARTATLKRRRDKDIQISSPERVEKMPKPSTGRLAKLLEYIWGA